MNQERLLKIILSPYISEKSSLVSGKNNQYVFSVLCCATKKEITAAVQDLFKVKVDKVRTSKIYAKTKSFKGKKGTRKAGKKAYVSLLSGEKIDFINLQ